jgi:hypothetical protein
VTATIPPTTIDAEMSESKLIIVAEAMLMDIDSAPVYEVSHAGLMNPPSHTISIARCNME